MVTQEQRILLDEAIRACEKMNWDLVIEDVSKIGFLKKLLAREAIPRIEGNGLILTGIPTSDEIIHFFEKEDTDTLSATPIEDHEIRIEISHECN
ncbi:MAG: hypothetical protein P1Q69_21000, partial [Candidatus Thorarchaeota archaeon]|nr:hypothetical protein [Candidatus Thorarchaeota archaeon]